MKLILTHLDPWAFKVLSMVIMQAEEVKVDLRVEEVVVFNKGGTYTLVEEEEVQDN